MSQDMQSVGIDLVRWSFAVDPTRRMAIEGYLADLGADVLVRDGREFVVIWDEPEGEFTDEIEAIWALNGEPFEVVQEAFQRLELHTLQHVDGESDQQAA